MPTAGSPRGVRVGPCAVGLGPCASYGMSAGVLQDTSLSLPVGLSVPGTDADLNRGHRSMTSQGGSNAELGCRPGKAFCGGGAAIFVTSLSKMSESKVTEVTGKSCSRSEGGRYTEQTANPSGPLGAKVKNAVKGESVHQGSHLGSRIGSLGLKVPRKPRVQVRAPAGEAEAEC